LVVAWTRGCHVSTSILYLAIVAIWAVFLVPAWLRRPHAPRAEADDAGNGDGASLGAPDDGEQDALPEPGTEPDGDDVPDGDEAPYAGLASDMSVASDLTDFGDERVSAAPVAAAAVTGRAGPRGGDHDADLAGRRGGPLGLGPSPWPDDGKAAWDGPARADGPPPRRVPARPASPRRPGAARRGSPRSPVHRRGSPQSREQMLRARRRMLVILILLTAFTVGVAYLGLVRWWICAPPVAMLVLYVMLLREVAKAEAELARKRAAWEARRRRAARRTGARRADGDRPGSATTRRPARERGDDGRWEPPAIRDDAGRAPATAARGRPATARDPAAEVIDISGRIGDQLYDQYDDAAARAVGD